MGVSRQWVEPTSLQNAYDQITEKNLALKEIEMQHECFQRIKSQEEYKIWAEKANWKAIYLRREIHSTEVWIRNVLREKERRSLVAGDYEVVISGLVKIAEDFADVSSLTEEEMEMLKFAKKIVGVR